MTDPSDVQVEHFPEYEVRHPRRRRKIWRYTDPQKALLRALKVGATTIYHVGRTEIMGIIVDDDVNQAPTVSTPPNQTFELGVTKNVDLKQWASDPDGTTPDVTMNEAEVSLPAGFAIDSSSVLVWNGNGVEGISTGHKIRASDGSLVSDFSGTFELQVTDSSPPPPPPGGGFFLPMDPNLVPRVDGLPTPFESAFGTCKAGESTVDIRFQRVVNLNDSGEGSLRQAMQLNVAERLVVLPDISGWVDLSNTLVVDASNMTYAGQAGPSGGLFTRGAKFRIIGDDILFQHLGCAHGGPAPGDSSVNDSLEIAQNNRVAFVNCAAWFGADETFSSSKSTDILVYNTLTAHGMSQGAPGQHNFGSLFDKAANVTMLRSAWYHNRLRNPRMPCDPSLIIGNCLHYNGHRYINLVGTNDVAHRDDVISNIVIAGPDGSSLEAVQINLSGGGVWNAGGQVYIDDLRLVGLSTELANDVGANIVGSPVTNFDGVVVTPFTGKTDLEITDAVQENMGPRPANRLPYFQSLVNQARNGVLGSGDRGGWCGLTRQTVYTGDGSGYDAITPATKDNFAELPALGGTLLDSGTNHLTYRFNVDQNTIKTPADTWLNQLNNDVLASVE